MLQILKSQIDSSMKSMQRLLQRPIKLDEGSLKLGTSKAKQREEQREEQRRRVRQMRRDLYTLLGQHASSRQLMRHLATVERALQEQGLASFEALPVRVIAKALVELERVVWDWSPTGLAELRSRMAVIVKNRPVAVAAAAAATDSPSTTGDDERGARTTVAPGSELDVSEVDLAEFEQMERSWTGVVPRAAAEPAAMAA